VYKENLSPNVKDITRFISLRELEQDRVVHIILVERLKGSHLTKRGFAEFSTRNREKAKESILTMEEEMRSRGMLWPMLDLRENFIICVPFHLYAVDFTAVLLEDDSLPESNWRRTLKSQQRKMKKLLDEAGLSETPTQDRNW
jgi:predicted XRE-type DNA-binding protein